MYGLYCILCGEIPVSVNIIITIHSGKHITRLRTYTEKLDKFHDGHKMNTYSDDQLVFNSQLMKWHLDFYSLLVSDNALYRDFSVAFDDEGSRGLVRTLAR